MPSPSTESALGPDNGTETGRWHAYHVFYHGDRCHLLKELVRPLVSKLVHAGEIDRFFFVRYALGGPHVRLRWRTVNGPETAADAMLDAAGEFFERWPSTESIPVDDILKKNEEIVADDPLADPEENSAFPDNCVRIFPVRFEVERYGGETMLGHSLDFFTISSSLVFALLDGLPASRRLNRMMRLVIAQAWGLAADATEFIDLAGYGVNFMGEYLPGCVDQGDRVFAARRDELCSVLAQELSGLAAGASGAGDRAPSFAEAARRFAHEVRETPYETRWFIGASHIHMTANRFGVFNPEEVYLTRMLSRAARHLEAEEPDLWRRIWISRPPRGVGPGERLEDLLPVVFDGLRPARTHDER